MAEKNGMAPKTLTLADIVNKYGLTPTKEHAHWERQPTGSLMLDKALGGGWARGAIHEIWGNPSYGKSLLTYISMGRVLRDGGGVVLFDMERRFKDDWAGWFMDVKHPNLQILNQDLIPDKKTGEMKLQNAEDILNSILGFATSGLADLIILDSKDAINFSAEIEGEVGPRNMGTRSFLLGQFMRLLVPIIKSGRTSFVFVSEVRAAFGRSDLTTSGGYKTEHACDIQVRLLSPEISKTTINGEEVVSGITLKPRTNKNATLSKDRDTEVQVKMFPTTNGYVWRMDSACEIIELGTELKLFTNASGEVYTGKGNIVYNGQDLGISKVAQAKLMADLSLHDELEAVIRQKMGW